MKLNTDDYTTDLPLIKEIMSDLRRVEDVGGTVLIRLDGSVMAMDLPSEIHMNVSMRGLLQNLALLRGKTQLNRSKSIFAPVVIQYNGFNVLTSSIDKDLLFVTIVKNKGYLGVAMLDIENTVREIRRIISGKEMSPDTIS